jgi:cobalamin-dependent methionine synthase I
MKAVMRRMGYPPGHTGANGAIQSMLDEQVKQARSLICAEGVFRLLKIRSLKKGKVRFHGSDFVLESELVAAMLRDSELAAFFMVTLGPALEQEVKRLLDEGDTTRGFILDAIGSETADEAADRMHHYTLKKLAKNHGYSVTPRFSPGYGDWPVTVQPSLAEICEGESIGIRVTKSCLMIPRKSVSAVLGWKR